MTMSHDHTARGENSVLLCVLINIYRVFSCSTIRSETTYTNGILIWKSRECILMDNILHTVPEVNRVWLNHIIL